VSAFTCDACGDSPETVLFDATLLACRKDFMSQEVAEDNSQEVIGIACTHRERTLLTKKQQAAVTKFSQSTAESPYKINYEDLQIQQPTKDFLKELEKGSGEATFCDPKWAEFVQQLAKNSPVCALIHPLCHAEFERLANGEPLDSSLAVPHTLGAPAVVKLLSVLSTTSLPPRFWPFFRYLLAMAKAPFANNNPAPIPAVRGETVVNWFPALPKVQERGRFSLDTDTHEVLFPLTFPSALQLTSFPLVER